MSIAEATSQSTESVEAFRQRARSFIQGNLRKLDPGEAVSSGLDAVDEEVERAAFVREREIQRMLFDAGLAGICFPREYGGQGLTPAHQQALNEELGGYEYPAHLQAPTFAPCALVLLDFGTEEQKLRHIPAILSGEEIWMQFLSEPSGGSDVAGALTTATREGDGWVLNGSKIWTTGAWWADWGLCLARTNWDVPKHRGLTVFMLPIRQPGVDIHRIEMLNGNMEFCQEFLTDVPVPDTDRIGEVDAGWTVGTRWMFHERMLFNSPMVTVPPGVGHGAGGSGTAKLVELAAEVASLDDVRTRALIGEARMLQLVGDQLNRRVAQGIGTGALSDQAAAVGRLFGGVGAARAATIGFEIAGSLGAAWTSDDGAGDDAGIGFLMRQTTSIGGGTTEMARNVISERVLGMPRERSHDPALPFREIPRSAGGSKRA